MPPPKKGQGSSGALCREGGEENKGVPVPIKLNRVAILGLGLMGASLGMALRAINRNVVGYDQAQGVADRALARGAIDRAARSPQDAVAGAELVVLAVPVLAIRELLEVIPDALPYGALVTDIGSVKSKVVAWAEEFLPQPDLFVGGHPMTGREQSGVDAALPDLYGGCIWCLTPTKYTASWAVDGVAGLTRELGAHSYVLDTSKHDLAAALVSHLPLIAATALMLTAADSTNWPAAQVLAAGGFGDTTRVASSSSRMARDICLTNQAAVLDMLDAYQKTLSLLRHEIATGDQAIIEHTFEVAREEREMWMKASRRR